MATTIPRPKRATVHTGESIWNATADMPPRPALEVDTQADVCIVGAGIAGLSTAYMVAKSGRKVVVIDDGPIAGGQTQCTTAHLASAIDDGYADIEWLHGEEGARLAAESHTAAINFIDETVRHENIDCDFARVDGYLFAPPGESSDILDREYAAARRTGVIGIKRVARVPWASFDTGPCLRFLNQGQFHPLRYLRRLAEAIERAGGRIFTGTHASRIEGGQPARIETKDGPVVTCGAVVVATNTPVNDLVAIHTKQAPYMTYAIGLSVPSDAVPRALYWDTEDPYHYIRLHSQRDDSMNGNSHETLIIGGEDHKTGQAEDGAERFARLEQWARERFPMAQDVAYRWSGQVMETVDGLAFIGHNPLDKDNVYVATGDSGMGMTHGTIAGLLLSRLIAGEEHPWRKLYDPTRKSAKALATFARENLNVAAQYGAWVTPGDVSEENDIQPGTGAVVRHGLKKLAVYRDTQGNLTRCSATCPHLMCVVAWNAVESTWDCPCHGSRFDPQGRVINGPANEDLARIDDEE